MISIIDICRISSDLLTYSDSSVVEYKIRTQFLHETLNMSHIMNLRRSLNNSKWVLDVIADQRENGGFGRFHSENTKIKQKYKTTQLAVTYLYYLGLARGDLPIDKACDYMESLLSHNQPWPDSWEHNPWFSSGVNLFITSRLSLFSCHTDPYNQVVDQWTRILCEAFSEEVYDPHKTDKIAEDIIGVDIHDSYIGLNAIHNIILFSQNTTKIPKEVQKHYLTWLHTYNKNVFYLTANLTKPPMSITKDAELTDWLILMGHLSRFDGFYDEFENELHWLMSLCNKDYLWDMHKALSKFKLSDHWRKPINRKVDQTLYVLDILKKPLLSINKGLFLLS